MKEGRAEQPVLMAHEEQLGGQPDAGGASQKNVLRGAAKQLPAEDGWLRSSWNALKAEREPPRLEGLPDGDRSVFQDHVGPLLGRSLLSLADVDKERVPVVDVGERAQPSRGRRHGNLAHPFGRR